MTREDVIAYFSERSKHLHEWLEDNENDEILKYSEAIDMAIEALKGRTDGEWREVEDDYGGVYWECSNCEDAFFLEVGTPKENNYNFCPSCGAYMRGCDDDE